MLGTQLDLLNLRTALGEPNSVLTKWINFDGEFGKKKLDCIKQSHLYLAFPQEFNDIFDSQLRLTEDDILFFAKKYASGTQIDIVARIVRYYQDFLNSSRITCFSTVSPLHEDSHNMWGLYGLNGQGVAFQYKTIDILNYYTTKLNPHKWRVVTYDPKRNPKVLFDNYLSIKRDHLNNPFARMREMTEVFESFYFIKRHQWEHELEVRVMSLDYVLEAAEESNHPLNMNCYINKDPEKAYRDVFDHRKQWNKKSIPFIKPCKIILGWQANLNCYPIKELIKFAKSNQITVQRLSDKIDYDNRTFISMDI